jgi:hypothetical protein
MKSLCLILFLALGSIPACSHSSAGGRQNRTYAKHLKKMRGERDRQRARLAKTKPKLPSPDTMVPSEPQEMTEISEGPQAVPGDLASQ